MLALPLLIGWSLFSSAVAPEPVAEACVYQPPIYVIRSETPQISIDHTMARAQIAAQLGNVEEGHRAQGMTAFDHSSKIVNNILTHEMPDGTICANLERVEVTVGFSEGPTVYIASEIPEGSCRYNATLTHERRHVGFALDEAANVGDRLQQTLPQQMQGKLPIIAQDMESAQKLAFAYIKEAISSTEAPYMAQERSENLGIDSQESYQALTDQCAGE